LIFPRIFSTKNKEIKLTEYLFTQQQQHQGGPAAAAGLEAKPGTAPQKMLL